MSESFKEWLCKLSGIDNADKVSNIDSLMNSRGYLEILIKAMWAINKLKRSPHRIVLEENSVQISEYNQGMNVKYFNYNLYDNNEQKALETALQYIFDNQ